MPVKFSVTPKVAKLAAKEENKVVPIAHKDEGSDGDNGKTAEAQSRDKKIVDENGGSNATLALTSLCSVYDSSDSE